MISNKEQVVAITVDGKQLPYRMGKLKDDFLKGKLAEQNITISHIYSKRLNKSIRVLYSPTKGFKYEIL